MRYLVIQRIWHSAQLRHVEPGETVGLAHLSPEAVDRLVQANVVMAQPEPDQIGPAPQAFPDTAAGLEGKPGPLPTPPAPRRGSAKE